MWIQKVEAGGQEKRKNWKEKSRKSKIEKPLHTPTTSSIFRLSPSSSSSSSCSHTKKHTNSGTYTLTSWCWSWISEEIEHYTLRRVEFLLVICVGVHNTVRKSIKYVVHINQRATAYEQTAKRKSWFVLAISSASTIYIVNTHICLNQPVKNEISRKK